MSKDAKGNYRATYQSKKQEWLCCFDWFSSEEVPSSKSDNAKCVQDILKKYSIPMMGHTSLG
jgi:hypothetical protein